YMSLKVTGVWPFGVQAFPDQHVFEVGTGLPLTQGGDALWGLYTINVVNQVGTTSILPQGIGITHSNYPYGTREAVIMNEPSIIQDGINYTFAGWQGIGNGSYTGPSSTAYVTMYSDITEIALWNETNTLQANIISLQNQVSALNSTNNALRQNETSLQSQLQQVEANQTALSNQLEQANSKLQNLTATLQSVESQKAALEQQNSNGFDFETLLAIGFAVSLVALVVVALKKRHS
ncbi:MAG: hypothetical protein M1368_12875, partial [Thaumarchaeota archaeon]|nr:hypothetical protein [Nitrososphaerota archaeon]